jgi:hypothetical protein
VDLELLVTPDCPHQESAAALLRTALDDVGLVGTEFKTTVIASADDAHRLGFSGSPTFLVNGQDSFAVPGAQPTLACRLYSSPGSVNLYWPQSDGLKWPRVVAAVALRAGCPLRMATVWPLVVGRWRWIRARQVGCPRFGGEGR